MSNSFCKSSSLVYKILLLLLKIVINLRFQAFLLLNIINLNHFGLFKLYRQFPFIRCTFPKSLDTISFSYEDHLDIYII